MLTAMDERLKELEIKISYQDEVIETLNQVVIELRGELTAVAAKLKALEGQVLQGSSADPSNDPPPHY